jgi:FK506-binding nuclear protein
MSSGTFWGLIVKPNKRYDTVVKESFRVCKACIEPASAADKVTSLMAEYDGEEYIIANLDKKNLNEQLDLAFSIGEKMAFKVEGPGTVHLTGNILEDESDYMDGDLMGEEEQSEEEDMEAAITNALKRKKRDSHPQYKKLKMALANGEDVEDDDSDDDSDSEMDTTAGDLDSTTNFAEEEDSDDDDDSDEGEDDDDDSDEEEEEVAPPAKKSPLKELKPANGQVKVNGSGDKTPKSKQPETPKSKKPEIKTPKPEAKTPTPKADVKTPKKELKTPKPDIKTPKPDNKTPKPDMKTPKEGAKTPKTPKNEGKIKAMDTPKSSRKTSKGGIQIEDIKEGTGPEAKPGTNVGMYYAGRLATNNKQFDACSSGKPFKFRLGKGEVIKGWEVGVNGLKVGGKRRLTIPPNMGYGAAGAPPDIPPNSTLVFDVECKYVK